MIEAIGSSHVNVPGGYHCRFSTPKTAKQSLRQKRIEHVATLFEQHGSNIWFEKEAEELLPAGFTHPGSPNGKFSKETDIMDVWFDSGSSHEAVLRQRPELTFPADMYLEGSDQYRGWFNSSITTSVAINGKHLTNQSCLKGLPWMVKAGR